MDSPVPALPEEISTALLFNTEFPPLDDGLLFPLDGDGDNNGMLSNIWGHMDCSNDGGGGRADTSPVSSSSSGNAADSGWASTECSSDGMGTELTSMDLDSVFDITPDSPTREQGKDVEHKQWQEQQGGEGEKREKQQQGKKEKAKKTIRKTKKKNRDKVEDQQRDEDPLSRDIAAHVRVLDDEDEAKLAREVAATVKRLQTMGKATRDRRKYLTDLLRRRRHRLHVSQMAKGYAKLKRQSERLLKLTEEYKRPHPALAITRDDVVRENRRLRDEYAALQRKNDEITRLYVNTRNTNAWLFGKLDEERAQTQKIQKALESERQQARLARNSLQCVLEQERAQARATKALLEDTLARERRCFQMTIDGKCKEIRSRDSMEHRLKELLEVERKRTKAKTRAHTQLGSQLKEARAAQASLEAQLKQARAAQASLEARLESERTSSQSIIAANRKRIASLCSDIEYKRTQIPELQRMAIAEKDRATELQKKIQALPQSKSPEKARVNRLRALVQQLQHQLGTEQATSANLKQQLTEALRNNDLLTTLQKQRGDDDKERLQTELETVERNARVLQLTIQKQKEYFEKETAALRAQLASFTKERGNVGDNNKGAPGPTA